MTTKMTAQDLGIELPARLWYGADGLDIKYQDVNCIGSELIGRFETAEEAQTAVNAAIGTINAETFYWRFHSTTSVQALRESEYRY